MRRGDLVIVTLVVAALGVLAPGCFHREEPFGQICASPVEGSRDAPKIHFDSESKSVGRRSSERRPA